ncbi:MFS transporter [Streptomyces lydicus]|uniref:MFS transporter n=1 Tax=Streptomyces lydicus TaxID=47763 RepID=UPI0010123BB0|nr:MFS transporter [Streptomyces lydicus]MCZ1012223.1 MFS transporter [Streptomyces lydicus]
MARSTDSPPQSPTGSAWTNRSFRAYWAGEATSLAGSSLHGVALPVIAVLELKATPGQVSLLTAAAMTPAFALSLPAGVVGDRCRKKLVMVATDLAAAAVVAAVPTCWAFGALSMPVLYAIALLLGALTVLHDAASTALVPELVKHEHLLNANSQITGLYNIADTSGVYGGTLVIGLVGAVRTLWLDCASYLISACCAARIRTAATPESTKAQRNRPRTGVLTAIREGISYVMHEPHQRPLVLALTVHAFAVRIVDTFLTYTLLTTLHSGSTGLGLVAGAAGAGGLAGSLATPHLIRRFGPYPVMLSGFLGYTICGVPLLLAQPGPAWLGVLAAAGAARRAVGAAAGSTQRSLRQQLCPPHLQSRAHQTCVCLFAGSRFFAALTAGAIAAVFGVWAALLVGTMLHLVPVVLLWASPVRHLTTMPCAPTKLPPTVHRQPTSQKEASRVP